MVLLLVLLHFKISYFRILTIVQARCGAQVLGVSRSGEHWNISDEIQGAVVDLWVYNRGYCYLNDVDIRIPLPAGGSIVSFKYLAIRIILL